MGIALPHDVGTLACSTDSVLRETHRRKVLLVRLLAKRARASPVGVTRPSEGLPGAKPKHATDPDPRFGPRRRRSSGCPTRPRRGSRSRTCAASTASASTHSTRGEPRTANWDRRAAYAQARRASGRASRKWCYGHITCRSSRSGRTRQATLSHWSRTISSESGRALYGQR